MNGEHEFERRLQSHPQRTLPESWREEILNAAKAAVPRNTEPARGSPGAPVLISWLTGLLWPAPRAWAGLAALWLVVLTLDLSSREPARAESARRTLPASPQIREMVRQQGELLAELAGPRGTSEAAKPQSPQPRSQRREESAMA